MKNRYNLFVMCTECNAIGKNERWHPVSDDPVEWFRTVAHYLSSDTGKEISYSLCPACDEKNCLAELKTVMSKGAPKDMQRALGTCTEKLSAFDPRLTEIIDNGVDIIRGHYFG